MNRVIKRTHSLFEDMRICKHTNRAKPKRSKSRDSELQGRRLSIRASRRGLSVDLPRRTGRANVDIDQATHKDLKDVKEKLGLKKLGDVVQVLADHYLGRDLARESDEEEEEDVGEPVKRRKIDVRPPLYSLELLSERRGMLEYYTGFDRPAVDLLIRRFSEVGLSHAFFPLLLLRQEASCGYASRVLFLSPKRRSSRPTLQMSLRATRAIETWIWKSESSCFLPG